MHDLAPRALAAALQRAAAASAALLLASTVALGAQSATDQRPAFDPRTDQETSPPAPRVHPSEADLIELMSPSDYVAPQPEAPTPAPPSAGEGALERRETPESAARSFTAAGIDAMLAAPLRAPDGDGGLWVRTRNQRTHFESDAVTVYPVFGSESPREWPVRFALESASVGGEPLELTPGHAPAQRRDGERIEVDRGALTEAWNLDVEHIEQTFVFDALPGAGDVVVRIAVETDLVAVAKGEDLVFESARFGGLRYGAAFAVDAAGARLPIERGFDGEHITLTVPADFAADAALPLTIDPLLNSFRNTFGADDDFNPDICFAGATGRYYFCWEDFTSASNSDVYLSSFTSTGVQGAVHSVDVSTDHWGTPSIGYVAGHERILVAASVSINGAGTWPSQIRGRVFDPVAGALVGADFPISTSGTEKRSPDVGGTNAELTFNNHFLVVWSRILASNRWSIEYRTIDFDGSGVSGIVVVDDAPDRQNWQPAVSASHGDADLTGDYWTIAWTQSDVGPSPSSGRIKARRVVWSGQTQFGSGNFTVNNNLQCSSPSVTSRLDRTYANATDRPSLVAYTLPTLGFHERDIWVSVVTAGSTGPPNPLTVMEDHRRFSDQYHPTIASDGRAFILGYTELSYIGATLNRDICVCSGTIAEDGSVARIGLAERHLLITNPNLFKSEHEPSIAMRRDGDKDATTDDGLIAYKVNSNTSPSSAPGYIRFTGAHAGTSHFHPDRNAVGRQYCDANLHSGYGSIPSTYSAWVWVEGDQVAGTTHWLHCTDMPVQTFAIALCSQQTGNTNLAGGQGRLCLGGSIGRFNSQLTNTGAAGEATFTLDTSAMPSGPTLVSAQPGQTWHFQVWFRDFVSTPTSNYSNAASVTFNP